MMRRFAPLLLLAGCGGEPPKPAPPVVMAPAPAVGLPSAAPAKTPRRALPKLPRGRSLAVQEGGTCVVHRGSLYCRKDPYALLPVPPSAPALFTPGSRLDIPGEVIDVATARNHGCAVNGGGKVYCWGDNGNGARGDGGPRLVRQPVAVPGLESAVAVAVAETHSCAATADGGVYCWGTNWHGEAGHDTAFEGDAIDLVRPVEVEGVRGIKALWASERLTCARSTGGDVHCWGDATGLGVDGPTPVAVEHLASAREIAFGRQSFWCRIPEEGQPVACRGRPYAAWTGLLPHRDTTYAGTEDVVELALGTEHACARSSTGKVLCWGNPTGGVLGRVVDAASFVDPGPVPGIDDAREIATGDYQTCALGRRHLYCWGANPHREDHDDARDAQVRRTRLPH